MENGKLEMGLRGLIRRRSRRICRPLQRGPARYQSLSEFIDADRNLSGFINFNRVLSKIIEIYRRKRPKTLGFFVKWEKINIFCDFLNPGEMMRWLPFIYRREQRKPRGQGREWSMVERGLRELGNGKWPMDGW